MATHKSNGNHFENIACHFLQEKGLLLLKKNYHTQMGEIDLIMNDGKTYVFVEVRARSAGYKGESIETVDAFKVKKIIKTAIHFLQQNKLTEKVNCRFDVIGIDSDQLHWLPNAFNLTDYYHE